MPFIDSAEGFRAKTHTSETKTPILIGMVSLIGIAVFMFGTNVFAVSSGAEFELHSRELSSSTTEFELENVAGSSTTVDSSSQDTNEEHAQEAPRMLYVFVSGAVQSPGVYALAEGSRVGDAINLAGGFIEEAASEYNNLARKIEDGEQIHVPRKEEVEQHGQGQSQYPIISSSGLQNQESSLVNINTATQAELETLPGIGPATAQKILASREAEGPFATVDDLQRVSGIGEKKYEALEGLICV